MERKRVAIFGGSFNPPGLHHVDVVRRLAKTFDKVVVVPCGPRPDKEITNDTAPSHRATMADLAFGTIPNVTVDLFDLENDEFTKNWHLQHRYAHLGIIHHVVGTDLLAHAEGVPVREKWFRGGELWSQSHFAVVPRKWHALGMCDIPPNNVILDIETDGSSTAIRERIGARDAFEHLVPKVVADYIKRYGLYHMSVPSRSSRLTLANPSVIALCDSYNDSAISLCDSISLRESENPDLIMSFGGDGTMLKAIRSEWRRRVPFYGVNLGRTGFLLNEWDGGLITEKYFRDLVVHRVPLLDVEMTTEDGETVRALGCNDAYVTKVDQTGCVRVTIDGIVRIPEMVADTVLVSTPAGSTAYAYSMGATPMLLGQQGLVLAATAVNEPWGWRPVHLPESVITFETLWWQKRPLIGQVDGQSFGRVLKMTVRVSRIASAELAFRSDADLNQKRTAIQFPERK